MRMYSLARPGLAGLGEMSDPKAEAEKIQDEPEPLLCQKARSAQRTMEPCQNDTGS